MVFSNLRLCFWSRTYLTSSQLENILSGMRVFLNQFLPSVCPASFKLLLSPLGEHSWDFILCPRCCAVLGLVPFPSLMARFITAVRAVPRNGWSFKTRPLFQGRQIDALCCPAHPRMLPMDLCSGDCKATETNSDQAPRIWFKSSKYFQLKFCILAILKFLLSGYFSFTLAIYNSVRLTAFTYFLMHF